MATNPRRVAKRQRAAHAAAMARGDAAEQERDAAAAAPASGGADAVQSVIVRFQEDAADAEPGPELQLPLHSTPAQLNLLLNGIMQQDDDPRPYAFYVGDDEVTYTLNTVLKQIAGAKDAQSLERVITIKYQPQALFRVATVTRCTSTLAGHTDPVLHVRFSPDGRQVASGSGDSTVRTWDLSTETPIHTMRAHSSWVLALAWSPDCRWLASGGMDGLVCIWDPEKGHSIHRKRLKGHTKWITALAWEPLHVAAERVPADAPANAPINCRLASAGKDGTVRIWDPVRGACERTLSGHAQAVKALVWGHGRDGTAGGLLYSASQDRTVYVWLPDEGRPIQKLVGHAHWVNTLALNTDAVLRSGAFDRSGKQPESLADRVAVCRKKVQGVCDAVALSSADESDLGGGKAQQQPQAKKQRLAAGRGSSGRELLVSGSDDFTLFLWDPTRSKKPIARMTGHQQPVNFVAFSPDGRHIASAGFDSAVKLWDGRTGRFIASFRGHVQAVYQLCWSADSRLLLSSSKDSTLKCWSLKTKRLFKDLPGHADEVFAVDWAPDGGRVASGGKDTVIKFWRK